MTAFPAPIGEPCGIQFIALDRLQVDHAYQRTLASRRSQSLVLSIANAWDWRLCVPLLVSERAEGLFILDGQHRWAAARMRADITHLPSAVNRFGSVAEEALLFVDANRKRVQVSRIDLFRAAIAAGRDAETAVDMLIRNAGLKLAEHTNPHFFKPGEIGCTSAILSCHRTNGDKLTGEVLDLIGQAFADEQMRYGGVIFLALVNLLKTPPAGFSIPVLVAALRKKGADAWALHPRVTMSTSGAQRALALRKVFVEQMGLAQPTSSVPSTAPPMKPAPSFEEQLAKVQNGEAGIMPAFHPRKAPPEQTLGGVGSAMV